MKKIKQLFFEECGQATTEYVLLIFFIVGAIITVGFALRSKLKGLLEGKIGNWLLKTFFRPEGMYRLPVRIPE